jgi:hypothetical protein
MPDTAKDDTVKDGKITRNARTGRVVSVCTAAGTSRATATSGKVVRQISDRRKDALKRLADR